MEIIKLTIKNFRGISSSELFFEGHTLLIGTNNIGKSTICEALDLVLGVDRLKRFPVVEEFDFFNANYLDSAVSPPKPLLIEIEVVMQSLPLEIARKYPERLEYWHLVEKRILGEGEIDTVDSTQVTECLRIKTIVEYNIEEDEFQAKTIFCSGPLRPDGEPHEVTRNAKQFFGFIYLRALRTGSRALSLERGSLLDLILQKQNIRTGIWENAIQQLKDLDPPIDAGAVNLLPVLENIEKRLQQYIPLADGRSTKLFVSQLKREHLRKTISFFIKTSNEQEHVPFQEVGTGTLNILVLALLTLLAEIKGEVIFAMEEPEIALPPHTQRRIVNYLLTKTKQCFITSHSPYVIEQFPPEKIKVLKRETGSLVKANGLPVGTVLKGKIYQRHARRGLAEAMLGCGVIVGEGITEKEILLAAAEKMEEADPQNCYALDLSGVSIISTDGDASIAEFGAFFKALEIKPFAFYDTKKNRTASEKKKIADNFFLPFETSYKGAEQMMVEEIPVQQLWNFLETVRDEHPEIPTEKPADNEIKKITKKVLIEEKGNRYAARLIELCQVAELPATVVGFLEAVYSNFKKPEDVSLPLADQPNVESPATDTVQPS